MAIPPREDRITLDRIALEICELHFRQAASLFGNLSAIGDRQARQMQCFTNNMIAMRDSQPLLYNTISNAIQNGLFQNNILTHHIKGGWDTLKRKKSNGKSQIFSPKENPDEQAKASVDKLIENLNTDHSIFLHGLKDGYVLKQITSRALRIASGHTVPVIIVEPDPEVIMGCLHLHEWFRPGQPFQSELYHWICDTDWQSALLYKFKQDEWLPPPGILACEDDMRDECAKAHKDIVTARDERTKDRMNLHISKRELCSHRAISRALLEPSKKQATTPKALIISNRFDADASKYARMIGRQMIARGWSTHMLIEKQDDHRLGAHLIAERLAYLEPNLVISAGDINGLKEAPIDANTPHMVWNCHSNQLEETEGCLHVQTTNPLSPTHLKNINNGLFFPALIESIVPPETEHFDRPKLTVFADAPPLPRRQLEQIIKQSIDSLSHGQAVKELGTAMIERYEKGGSIQIPRQLHLLAERNGLAFDTNVLSRATETLWPLNESLFLLHTLRWAIKACAIADAQLAIYGKGWETLGPLVQYAHPAPKRKPQRLQIIQHSSACLHAYPGYPLTPEMIQLVSDGAAVLVRDHPTLETLPQLASLLAKHAPNSTSLQSAQRRMSGEDLDTLNASAKRLEQMVFQNTGADAISIVRSCVRCGLLDDHMNPWAHHQANTFTDNEDLARKLQNWHENPDRRALRIQEQQLSLRKRFGIDAALRRGIVRLGKKFIKE